MANPTDFNSSHLGTVVQQVRGALEAGQDPVRGDITYVIGNVPALIRAYEETQKEARKAVRLCERLEKSGSFHIEKAAGLYEKDQTQVAELEKLNKRVKKLQLYALGATIVAIGAVVYACLNRRAKTI